MTQKIAALKTAVSGAKDRARRFRKDTKGLSHMTEIMIGIAIVVVVGGLIITAASGTLPDIFDSLMTAVSNMFAPTTP